MKLLEPLNRLVKKYTFVTNQKELEERDNFIRLIIEEYKSIKRKDKRICQAIKFLKKYEVDVAILLDCENYLEYNERLNLPITEERFNLLKEVFNEIN